MDDMHLKYFRINSWNGNLIFHQTRGVSWLNVSVSQATCQTWPLSNDDDGCSSLEQSVWWWSCICFLMAGWVRFGFSCYCPWNQHTWYLKNWWTNKYTFSLPFFGGEITHQKFAAVKQKGHQKIHQHIVGDPKKIPFPLFAPGSSDAMWNFSLSQHVTRAHCPLVSRLDKVICRV